MWPVDNSLQGQGRWRDCVLAAASRGLWMSDLGSHLHLPFTSYWASLETPSILSFFLFLFPYVCTCTGAHIAQPISGHHKIEFKLSGLSRCLVIELSSPVEPSCQPHRILDSSSVEAGCYCSRYRALRGQLPKMSWVLLMIKINCVSVWFETVSNIVA